jgi:hypothetical protein
MTNDETPNDERMTNPEARSEWGRRAGVAESFRHSSFATTPTSKVALSNRRAVHGSATFLRQNPKSKIQNLKSKIG